MRSLKAIFFMLGIFACANLSALGLGKLQLDSHLNEPFSASILLIGSGPDHLDSVSVFLADPDQFKKAGLDRPFILATLQFTVIQDEEDGPEYIKISSQQLIREPFLNFLLEIVSPDGRLIQEFSVLLDPTPGSLPASAQTAAQPFTAQVSEDPDPVVQTRTADEERADDMVSEEIAAAEAAKTSPASSEELPATVALSYNGETYGPVKDNDTLWSVSNALRPDNAVSVHQMMLALMRENPEAFPDGSVNGLRAGQTLRVPDRSNITSISKSEALETLKQQYAW
jgi:pilus assembly protein FimV